MNQNELPPCPLPDKSVLPTTEGENKTEPASDEEEKPVIPEPFPIVPEPSE